MKHPPTFCTQNVLILPRRVGGTCTLEAYDIPTRQDATYPSHGTYYTMGFCGNCVAANMNVTGVDTRGHEWTPEDIFCEKSA